MRAYQEKLRVVLNVFGLVWFQSWSTVLVIHGASGGFEQVFSASNK
jgi:hypothetical protein